MPEKTLLIIHPYDNTTIFLERIRNALQLNFPDQIHYFNIKPNEHSHKECLERIGKHPSEGLIIFLGHGRSDKLYGSKGDFSGNLEFASIEAVKENPEKFYSNDDFINEENVEVFKNKKVFCFSCNSNSKIGQVALRNGVQTFFGFGDMPTSEGEFGQKGYNVSGDLVRFMKTELCYIIKTALVYSLQNSYSFEQLLSVIHFIANQRIASILVDYKFFNERHLLADFLYFFKKEIKIYGDETLPLLGTYKEH